MKTNKIMRSLLFNWPVKIFSLLLAVGIYMVVNYATLDTRRVEIPLQVIMPSGYEASSNVPESVTLHIRADERYIGMVDSSAINATADFSKVADEGAFSAPILLDTQKSYMDIDVSFSTKPETVRLYLVKLEVVAPADANLGGIEL